MFVTYTLNFKSFSLRADAVRGRAEYTPPRFGACQADHRSNQSSVRLRRGAQNEIVKIMSRYGARKPGMDFVAEESAQDRAARYRNEAQSLRASAADLLDLHKREELLRMAETYERLAERLARARSE